MKISSLKCSAVQKANLPIKKSSKKEKNPEDFVRNFNLLIIGASTGGQIEFRAEFLI